MKILIAEDDEASLYILTEITKEWGYEPVIARDGEEAWEILKKPDAPKLVLLDWMMPGMNGLDVCRRAQTKDGGDSPYIIFLTSKNSIEDLVECLEAGASDFIAKPYNNTELKARINVGRKIVQLQSELRKAREDMARKALHDSLTGIFNRGAILEILEKELNRARREKRSLTIGLFDIDHFKDINDTYGHLAGDKILCGIVSRLQMNLRKYDQVGRLGGEEFIVISPFPASGESEEFYERLRSSISDKQFLWKETAIPVTISIGVADSSDCESVSEMLAKVDAAMYRAKAEGRNRVVFA